MGWNQPEPVEEPEGRGGGQGWVIGAGVAVAVLLAPIAIVAGGSAMLLRRGVRARWLVAGAAVALLVGLIVVGPGGILGDYGAGYGALAGGHGSAAEVLFLAIPLGLAASIPLAGAWWWHSRRKGRAWPRTGSPMEQRAIRAIHRVHTDVPHDGVGLRHGVLHPPARQILRHRAPTDLITVGRPVSGRGVVIAPIHVCVIGATGAGKGRGLIIPAILSHCGPVLAASTKDDIVRDQHHQAETWAYRRSLGECWVFDLTGEMERRGYPPPRWSPLWQVTDWRGAVLGANVIAMAAGRGGEADGKSSFFSQRAIESIGAYLFAAHLDGADMGQVLRWLQAGKSALEGLAKILEGHEAALTALAAGGSDSSVADALATARTFLTPWQDPRVCELTSRAEWTPDDLLSGMGTCYVLSLESDPGRLRNVYTLFVADALERARYLARNNGGRLDPPLLAAIDETANVSPIATLPNMLTTCREYARVISVWHDIGELREAFGARAGTVLANSGTQIWFPTGDNSTAEELVKALGKRDYRQLTTSPGPGQGQESTQSREAAAVNEVTTMHCPLRLGGGLPACEIRPRYYDQDPVLSARSEGRQDPVTTRLGRLIARLVPAGELPDDTPDPDDDTPDPDDDTPDPGAPRPEQDDEVVDYSLPEGLFDGAGQGMSA